MHGLCSYTATVIGWAPLWSAVIGQLVSLTLHMVITLIHTVNVCFKTQRISSENKNFKVHRATFMPLVLSPSVLMATASRINEMRLNKI